ncbi:MAG: ComEC/Rec2 family competence protein [Candidatus Limnocylindria bacterium]
MGVDRHALPVVLLGVAAGILAVDSGRELPATGLLLVGAVTAVTAGVLGRQAGALLLLGVALAGAGIGAWRQDSADPTRLSVNPTAAILVDGAEHELLGTVMDDPRPREDRIQLVLGELTAVADRGSIALEGRVLTWLPRGIDASAGDRLRIRATVELPEDFDGFAYREYLARQGVLAIARPRAAEVSTPASGPVALLAGTRSALLNGLNRVVPEPEAALGAGILLGVRAAIAPEINEAFATAGLTHVVAISGWNIAIVAALVAAAVRPLARRPGGRWTTAIVAAAVVGGYVVLTGASPSVVRAALMAGAMLIARLGGSRAHAASALELAALLMLLAAPAVLWDVGFQLSLLATAGLIWYGPAVERRLPRWPGWIREPVALTLAAQLTTLPVILVNFERLSLVAPLANVLVVPFIPIAMLLSAVASVGGAIDSIAHVPGIGDAATWFAGGAAWLVLRVVIVIGTAVASLPHAAVDLTLPPLVAVAWLPILAVGSWALAGQDPDERSPDARAAGAAAGLTVRILRPLPMASVLVAVLLGVTVASRPDGRLHVTTLDIGQGDAILVETPSGATMLVDGGPDPELTLRRLGANLPFSARRIDLLVLSHPHQDHVAGLVDVLARFRIGALLHGGIHYENPAYHRLLADASASGVGVRLARAGQQLILDATTTVQILYPAEADAAAPLPEGDINNGSVVVLVRTGGFSALLTGDAEAPIESMLVARGTGAVDMLKVGHHGSTSSTTLALLEATRPGIAVISSGQGNEYGHPAPETLAALAARSGLVVFRTDTHGDVEVATDGRTYAVRTDAGWTAPRPVHGMDATASIGSWPSPIAPPPARCSPMRTCPMASFATPRVLLALPLRPPVCSPRLGFRLTAPWSRRQHCSTTSTRSRSGGRAVSTASSGRDGSRRPASRSSPCRSPPTRSVACWTRSASRSAGLPSWWPSLIGTWRRSSSPSTRGWMT